MNVTTTGLTKAAAAAAGPQASARTDGEESRGRELDPSPRAPAGAATLVPVPTVLDAGCVATRAASSTAGERRERGVRRAGSADAAEEPIDLCPRRLAFLVARRPRRMLHRPATGLMVPWLVCAVRV